MVGFTLRLKRALTASRELFRVDITPYLISPLDRPIPNEPIRKQVTASAGENSSFIEMTKDSLAD